MLNCPGTGETDRSDWETEKRKLKLLFKVYSTQDLAYRSTPPQGFISPLQFLKFLGMQELLAGQVFFALDLDGDGLMSREDFITGCLRMGRGNVYEKATFIFTVLDFSHKGFLTPQDLHAVQSLLPCPCPLCPSPCPIPHLLSNPPFLFIDTPTSLFDSYREIYDHFFLSVFLHLPAVLLDALSFYPCLPTDDLLPLCIDSRTYLCSVHHSTVYAYRSVDPSSLKRILFLGDLFISPWQDAAFQLKARGVVRTFTADTPAQRDQWVDRIVSEQGVRWFDDYYCTKEKVGDGASGTVLRSEPRNGGVSVAVKIIDKSKLDDRTEARLRQEVTILQAISHPNLLRYYDVFETYERTYVVTELIDEGTLFEHLEARKFSVGEEFAKRVVGDVANGLKYLHENGVVHRDVKLENVMLKRDRQGGLRAVIIDFGLAVCLGPKEMAREPVGTLKYAAPEIITHMKYREKVDCWSLGVILYILLQGKVPFYGKTDQEVAVHILKRHIQFFGEKWVDVSPQAIEVVSGLLLRKPDQRWSVSDVLNSDWMLCRSEPTTGFVTLGTESVDQSS